jgi:AraC-like DNA-binding protein
MSQYLIPYPEKSYPRLTHFGYSDEPRDFDSGMHRHIGYEFVFFFSGAAEIQVRESGPPLYIGEDDLLIMPPDIPHKFATPPRPLQYSWLGFQAGARIAGVTDRLMFPPDTELNRLPREELRFTEDRDPGIETISGGLAVDDILVVRKIPDLRGPFEHIKREVLYPQLFSREIIHLKILELLTLILRRMKRPNRPVFEYAAEYIDTHCCSPLDLGSIAGRMGYHSSYFSRKFGEHFGISPMRYLRRCRINRAKELLSAGRDIAASADACGFSDVHYFYRVFKEETGLTPGEYAAAAAE